MEGPWKVGVCYFYIPNISEIHQASLFMAHPLGLSERLSDLLVSLFLPWPISNPFSLAAQVIDLKLVHSSSLATALSRQRKKPITCCGREGADPCLPLCPHFAPFSFICYPDLLVSLCLKPPRVFILPASGPCWVSSHSWVLFPHSSPLASASPYQRGIPWPPWLKKSSLPHQLLSLLLQQYIWQEQMKEEEMILATVPGFRERCESCKTRQLVTLHP